MILDALVETVTGVRREAGPVALPLPRENVGDDMLEGGGAYEVMYLLDAEEPAVHGLRATLAELGDSLVVVGGGGLWNVHVHVDDVGAAIEAGIVAGRPHRIRVTDLRRDTDLRAGREGRGGRAVVAVAHGPGTAALLEASGAVVVRAHGNVAPSTAELLDGVDRAAPPRSCCSRATPTSGPSPRRPPSRRAPRGHAGRRWSRPARSCRRSPPSPVHDASRCRSTTTSSR